MKASLSTEESLCRLYGRDQGELPPLLRRLFTTTPSGVVQPRTEEEAAEAIREAYAKDTPIVFRGAGSSAFGQSVPVLGGLVLDVSSLKQVRSFDPDNGTVTVEAGVRWADLAAFLEERACAFGSYPSSWYSTVGGWVQTGGCGMLTHRFGALKSQVSALRVCVGDGRVAEFTSGHPDFEAFFQTEGQMGLVLQATLRIRPKPEGEYPVLVEFKDEAEAWRLYALARQQVRSLVHASVYGAARMAHFNHTFRERMEKKASELGKRGVCSGAPAVLLVVERYEEFKELRAWVRAQGHAEAPAFASSYVWAERFYPLKGKRADQMFLGNELILPDAQLARYSAAIQSAAKAQGVELAVEANAAEPGETVVIASFYTPYGREAEFAGRLPLVFRMDRAGVEGCGGRLYHVGTYNTWAVDRKFTPEKLGALKAAKLRLDPKGLFNPGKFFEMKTRWTGWLSPAAHFKAARWLIPRIEDRPWLARLAAGLVSLLPFEGDPKLTGDALQKVARECVNCGFCIPVCPAYLATQDERTTARGKLNVFLSGRRLSAKDVELLHSCMHCGACTEVCQSTLDLVPAWRELESRVAEKAGGRPVQAIEKFVGEVEASADYQRLLRRGYIVERQVPGR